MIPPVIRLSDKLATFTEHWAPRIVAALNDYHVKVVRVEGDFTWHAHPDTDELFLVLAGELRIDFRTGQVNLCAGDLLVIPRGMEHKPFAESECHLLLIEPAGTVNTGDAGGEQTAPADVWA